MEYRLSSRNLTTIKAQNRFLEEKIKLYFNTNKKEKKYNKNLSKL